MSLPLLANLLNESSRLGRALISEGDTSVSLSELDSWSVRAIVAALNAVGCSYQLHDGAFNLCDVAEVEDGEEGFLITFKKPTPELAGADTLYLLTEPGLADHLRKGHPAIYWRVVGLSKPIRCKARILGGWEDELPVIIPPATKAPRLLVKEAASVRVVPGDVQHWVLEENHQLDPAEAFHSLWAQFAYESLGWCIANEIEGAAHKLIFKGPPKLILQGLGEDPARRALVTIKDFELLHESVSWVYENAREAEIKHVLFSAEVARSGRTDGEVIGYFQENLVAAFECAKIAYQMSISEITRDTLKSLADLRKAVTEETAKATDATRQTVAAIASALAVGLGMIVARISVALNPWLVLLVMIVALGYVVLVAMSGWHFILVQRSVRKEWQLKLYRFLSADDYEMMVTVPIGKSERVFSWSALGGGGILLLAAVSISAYAFVGVPATAVQKVENVTPASSAPAHPRSNRIFKGFPQSTSA